MPQQPLFVQCIQELDKEERVALGAFTNKVGERFARRRRGMQRVGHQLVQMLERQRRELELRHRRATVADRLEAGHQRMARAHFVVAIGADQKQIAHV